MIPELTPERLEVIERGDRMMACIIDATNAVVEVSRRYRYLEGFTWYWNQLSDGYQFRALQEADRIAMERGFECYDPNVIQAGLSTLQSAMTESRQRMQEEANRKAAVERETLAKAAIWREVCTAELKKRGVNCKGKSLTDLEIKHFTREDDRHLRSDANFLAKKYGHSFRF